MDYFNFPDEVMNDLPIIAALGKEMIFNETSQMANATKSTMTFKQA